ncbi:Spc98 family protein [Microthyrium microscopicum]|uniref:Spindle pole body component n=1 Tax=Microthyrium microscopicum TaxID=703497 RepID=A0A6A6ULA0_9PEZI|nr:Spc98 family protein [Microthyrium microscopicum]
MLHEILLSLSGHPSPLFQDGVTKNGEFPMLSPSEKELLKKIGRLSILHQNIRKTIALIASSHSSPICKAVATTIESYHLSNFQKKILEVEEAILQRDSAVVGAYNIVPLATIVTEFDGWHRLMEWLWEATIFIAPSKREPHGCNGPDLINRLRNSAQTGFPDIEDAAIQLSKVAEAAWLRQLAKWVLYGQLPESGSSDFLIQPGITENRSPTQYEIIQQRRPVFVSNETATSILFVGQALHQISSRSQENSTATRVKPRIELLPAHQKMLSSLRLPISSPHLSESVREIRLSLSRNILQKLLPVSEVIRLLTLLREFFLLGQGEFALSIIREADDRVAARTRQYEQKPGKDGLQGLVMKDAELTAILTKTWTHLSSLIGNDDDDAHDLLEMGRDLITLSIGRNTNNSRKDKSTIDDPSSKSHFSNFILPIPTSLDLSITQPFDLFISQSEIQTYSALNAYLLAIRRGHMHIADLWKQSSIRRDHPTPLGPPKSCTTAGQRILQKRRERSHARYVEMRKVWATCHAVLFLLNELGEYFAGQVLPAMWDDLLAYITNEPTSAATSHSTLSSRPPTANSSQPPNILPPSTPSQQPAHDPATLSTAHRIFLTALSHALLYTDTPFLSALTTLLHAIDDMIAQIMRLQTVQRNMDLEEDEGVFDAMENYVAEAAECAVELDRARKRVDSGARAVVGRLKELSAGDGLNGVVSGIGGIGLGNMGVGKIDGDGYRPVVGGKIEWLIMKLEFGRDQEDGEWEED